MKQTERLTDAGSTPAASTISMVRNHILRTELIADWNVLTHTQGAYDGGAMVSTAIQLGEWSYRQAKDVILANKVNANEEFALAA